MVQITLCRCEGCQKPKKVKGFCTPHYLKFHRHGDPLFKSKRTTGEEIKEFLNKAIKYDNDECLIYPYSKQGSGYGSAKIKGKTTLVHRYVCEAVHGKSPRGKPFVLHSCPENQRSCCNPNHLRWGSHSENMLDRYKDANKPGGVLSLAKRNGSDNVVSFPDGEGAGGA